MTPMIINASFPPLPTLVTRLAAMLVATGGALGLVACNDESTTASTAAGGSGAATSVGGQGGGGGTAGAGGTDAGYPPPPYGNEVSNTFPLLAWEGHVNLSGDSLATGQPFVEWSSDDVRTAGSDHALVHLAATF